MIAKGSKSFSLASLLFSRRERVASHHLYSWCRHCDDAIDEAPSKEAARISLKRLESETHAAFNGAVVHDPAFRGFQAFCRDYKVPAVYPLELLEGMRMDLESYAYRSQGDLELYCYRVASVVGLMMVHAMGVSSERALPHAVATGLAMQMTNIARDLREDHQMGRVYIPDEWFLEVGLSPCRPTDPFDAEKFALVSRRLVREADKNYVSGREGLKYLPLRAAFAVAAAQEIYREIGMVVLKRGSHAWDQRAVVSLPRKLWLLTKACTRLLPLAIKQLFSPWRRANLTDVYTPARLKG